jgi:hypothetical protein
MPDLRQAEGLHQEIRALPDLLPKHGLEGRDPGRSKGQLVELAKIGDKELIG